MESARVRSGDLNPERWGGTSAMEKAHGGARADRRAARGAFDVVHARHVAYLRADMAIVMVGAFDACVWRERL